MAPKPPTDALKKQASSPAGESPGQVSISTTGKLGMGLNGLWITGNRHIHVVVEGEISKRPMRAKTELVATDAA